MRNAPKPITRKTRARDVGTNYIDGGKTISVFFGIKERNIGIHASRDPEIMILAKHKSKKPNTLR